MFLPWVTDLNLLCERPVDSLSRHLYIPNLSALKSIWRMSDFSVTEFPLELISLVVKVQWRETKESATDSIGVPFSCYVFSVCNSVTLVCAETFGGILEFCWCPRWHPDFMSAALFLFVFDVVFCLGVQCTSAEALCALCAECCPPVLSVLAPVLPSSCPGSSGVLRSWQPPCHHWPPHTSTTRDWPALESWPTALAKGRSTANQCSLPDSHPPIHQPRHQQQCHKSPSTGLSTMYVGPSGMDASIYHFCHSMIWY